ncbi:uncharacterized protein LOC134823775 [Bolinopsis microptera]|uniref:uncharacterized protein LOC134823775 n=1 Tax=Bolinopsis microptera TaxID=2820187 RepID=UPI0030790FE4
MGIEFRADKLKKPKNILILAQILFSVLSSSIISLWRDSTTSDGIKFSFGYQRLPKGSYLGFLVAMTVCLLIVKAIVLFLKLISLQEKVPYFDVFNLFLSAAMVALLGLACILGVVVVNSTTTKHRSKHTLPAGVVFGWFAVTALTVETVLSYLELRK